MQVAQGLRSLYLATRHSNVWSDGVWTDQGLLRFQERVPHVAVCHTFDPAPLLDWRSLDPMPEEGYERLKVAVTP